MAARRNGVPRDATAKAWDEPTIGCGDGFAGKAVVMRENGKAQQGRGAVGVSKKIHISGKAVPTESHEQMALAEYLDLRRDLLWCHVPNGGNRSPITGARLKREGVKPGVPDVLIFTPRIEQFDALGHWEHRVETGLAIELKRVKGGSVSEDQARWHHELIKCGWRVVVCRGSGEAIACVERYYGRGKRA